MLPGITSPFGELSRSPGYVSDSLLTRSPLDGYCYPVRLACLSHAASVQAEPGSNSSIEFLGTAHPDARCDSCELTETDTFKTVFIHEMSLSKPVGFRLSPTSCYCPNPAKDQGQSQQYHFLRSSIIENCLQGSNILDGLLKKNDQGRSLTCMHHEE